MIGGLFTSTVLSLLVVPVVFEQVDDFKNAILRRLAPSLAAGAHRRADGQPPVASEG